MTDNLLASLLSGLVGAVVGGIISALIARKQIAAQFQVVRDQISAQEKQIAAQRQWVVLSSAVERIADIFQRVEPLPDSSDSRFAGLHRRLIDLQNSAHKQGGMIISQLRLTGIPNTILGVLNQGLVRYQETLGQYIAGQIPWDEFNMTRVDIRAEFDNVLQLAAQQAQ